MKLSEIRGSRHSTDIVEVEPAGGIYGTFNVEVSFDYKSPSSTRHERDDDSFREKHPGQLIIHGVILNQDVEELNDDDQVVHEYKKGMKAKDLPGWDTTDDNFVFEVMYERLVSGD